LCLCGQNAVVLFLRKAEDEISLARPVGLHKD
jgi:hypothetical protein